MKPLERIFHILAFSLQCGAVVALLLRSAASKSQLGESNPVNTVATAAVLAIVMVLTLRHAKTILRYSSGVLPVLAVAILAIVSTAWSDYPDITVRRAASLMTTTAWALYLTARFDLKDIIAVIRQSITLMAIGSLALGIVAPNLGQDDPMGPPGWQGLFATKNDLGIVVALGVVTYFYTLVIHRKGLFSFLLSLAGLLLCLGLLYLSQSRTCWLIGLLGPLLCLTIRLTHKRIGVAIIIWTTMVLLLAPTVVIVTDELRNITPLLGRDPQLTGRVDLWLTLPSFIAERPWIGYGLGGFWVVDSPNVALVWGAVNWTPPHAHNGWLDLLLELGITGFALVGLQLVMIIVKGIRAIVDGSEPDAQYVLVMAFIALVYNLVESNLVRPGVMWVLFVVAATALAKIGKQQRATARPGFVGRYPRRAPAVSSRLG